MDMILSCQIFKMSWFHMTLLQPFFLFLSLSLYISLPYAHSIGGIIRLVRPWGAAIYNVFIFTVSLSQIVEALIFAWVFYIKSVPTASTNKHLCNDLFFFCFLLILPTVQNTRTYKLFQRLLKSLYFRRMFVRNHDILCPNGYFYDL